MWMVGFGLMGQGRKDGGGEGRKEGREGLVIVVGACLLHSLSRVGSVDPRSAIAVGPEVCVRAILYVCMDGPTEQRDGTWECIGMASGVYVKGWLQRWNVGPQKAAAPLLC